MSQAILESPWGHETYHMCVVKTLEEACVDWTIEKDWDCGGNDIAPDPYVPGKHIYLKNYHPKTIMIIMISGGLEECQDLCLANQPKCNAIAMTTAKDPNNPNRCWMKSKLENCHPAHNQLTGTLMHYDCRDNHNCGGSYVQIKECFMQTQVI